MQRLAGRGPKGPDLGEERVATSSDHYRGADPPSPPWLRATQLRRHRQRLQEWARLGTLSSTFKRKRRRALQPCTGRELCADGRILSLSAQYSSH